MGNTKSNDSKTMSSSAKKQLGFKSFAKTYAKLIESLNFKVNEKYQIKSYLHLIMFVLKNGHKIYFAFPELLTKSKILCLQKVLYDKTISPIYNKIPVNYKFVKKNDKYIIDSTCMQMETNNSSDNLTENNEINFNKLIFFNLMIAINVKILNMDLVKNDILNMKKYANVYHKFAEIECNKYLLQLILQQLHDDYEKAFNFHTKYKKYTDIESQVDFELLIQNDINVKQQILDEITEDYTDIDIVLSIIDEIDDLKKLKSMKDKLLTTKQIELFMHNVNVFENASKYIIHQSMNNNTNTENTTNIIETIDPSTMNILQENRF